MNLLKLKDQIKSLGGGIVLVDFYQNDCRYCELLAPQLREVEEDGAAAVISVNLSDCEADDRKELIDHYALMSTPTVIICKNGTAVDRFSGFMIAAAIQGRIASA